MTGSIYTLYYIPGVAKHAECPGTCALLPLFMHPEPLLEALAQQYGQA